MASHKAVFQVLEEDFSAPLSSRVTSGSRQLADEKGVTKNEINLR